MSTWLIHDLCDALFGIDSRKQLGEKLKGYGATTVWYIYDAALAAIADELIGIMKDAGLTVTAYAAERGEPSGGMCARAVESARAARADALVGFGGGATMDTAKMVGKVLANGGVVEDYLGGYTALNVGAKVFRPLVLLPSTSGTGSEVNHGMAIYNEKTNLKTFAMQPATLAIVDPVLTVSMPKDITASTGADALAHCMEPLCNSDAMPNWMGDMICKEGITQIFKWLEKAYNNGSDLEARAGMCYAAMLGGYAVTLCKTTIGHALANQISNNYSYGHGVAIAPGNSVVVRYNVTGDPASTRRIAPCLGIPCPEGADVVAVGKQVVDKLDALQKAVGLRNMKELGIPPEFCDRAADGIAKDPKWKFIPNPPDFELLRKVIHEAYDC